jgi:hypothetical protein
MEAKHAGKAGQATHVPHAMEPRESDREPTREEAIALLEANLPVAWAVTFAHHQTPDGPRYIDTRSGELYESIPTLQDDGKTA